MRTIKEILKKVYTGTKLNMAELEILADNTLEYVSKIEIAKVDGKLHYRVYFQNSCGSYRNLIERSVKNDD